MLLLVRFIRCTKHYTKFLHWHSCCNTLIHVLTMVQTQSHTHIKETATTLQMTWSPPPSRWNVLVWISIHVIWVNTSCLLRSGRLIHCHPKPQRLISHSQSIIILVYSLMKKKKINWRSHNELRWNYMCKPKIRFRNDLQWGPKNCMHLIFREIKSYQTGLYEIKYQDRSVNGLVLQNNPHKVHQSCNIIQLTRAHYRFS